MGRMRVRLVAIAVIAIVSLAMYITILTRSGDESAGSSPGQSEFDVELAGESLGSQVSEARKQRLERREQKQKEEKEDKKKGLR